MIIKEDQQSQMVINVSTANKKLFFGIYNKELSITINIDIKGIKNLYEYLGWWLGKNDKK